MSTPKEAGRRRLQAAIRRITVDQSNDRPNGTTEAALERVDLACERLRVACTMLCGDSAEQRVRDEVIDLNGALSVLCEAMADDTKELREAAEMYFGGDFARDGATLEKLNDKKPSADDMKRLYAESAARAFRTVESGQRSAIEQKRRTIPQALSVARRRLASLRNEYFARDRIDCGFASEDAWGKYGPDKDFQELVQWATAIADERGGKAR